MIQFPTSAIVLAGLIKQRIRNILHGFRTTNANSAIQGDTINNHHRYLKFYSETGNSILIRQENKRIYAWSISNNNDFLLYDFNVKKGDTIHSSAQSSFFLRLPVVLNVNTK